MRSLYTQNHQKKGGEVKHVKHPYADKSAAQLIKIATRHFNEFIRKRDAGKSCINCGKFRTLQAGHFYATGHYSGLRFNENNVHGECLQCNYFNSQSHSTGYLVNLKTRIGEEAFKELEFSAASYRRTGKKWMRIELIEIIEKYKELKKAA